MTGALNFGAGPAMLPARVLDQAQLDLVSLPGIGVSPLEISHRGSWFQEVIGEAEANIRELLQIPQTHHVVFCQGGATLQFSMVAMNLLRGSGKRADYVVTGAWGEKATAEARKEGEVRVVWSGADGGFCRVPATEELLESLDGDPAYVHTTSNETIHGVEFPDSPVVPEDAALVSDMSSDFLSRPVDVERYALVYAGAQKNAGPSGVTVVVVRDDVLGRIPDELPTLMDYRTYVEHGSLYNTPPVFSIYVLMLVTRWLCDDVGGLDEQLAQNLEKAGELYRAIDESEGFYRGHAEPGSRSLMNVTFRLATEELDRAFVAEAAAAGMVELKGHRSVGGIRASIYNAMPVAGAVALADFMRAFAAAHRNASRSD